MSNTIQAPYHTSDQSSFAYVSARDRWPVILVSAMIVYFETSLARLMYIDRSH